MWIVSECAEYVVEGWWKRQQTFFSITDFHQTNSNSFQIYCVVNVSHLIHVAHVKRLIHYLNGNTFSSASWTLYINLHYSCAFLAHVPFLCGFYKVYSVDISIGYSIIAFSLMQNLVNFIIILRHRIRGNTDDNWNIFYEKGKNNECKRKWISIVGLFIGQRNEWLRNRIVYSIKI